ncbi:MAG: hypothetical protein ABDH28_03880 [Brevinematia bacterium]
MDVKELVARGIPERVANFLVSYFGGDYEKIYSVLNSLKKDVVVLKLKFSFSLYSGFAIVFVNLRSKKVELVKSFVSHSTEITKISVESQWREILEKLSSEYKSLQIDPDLSAKAEIVLTSDAKFVQTLVKVMSEDRTYLDVKRFLYTYIPVIFGDENTIVRFAIERMDVFQFYKFARDIGVEIPSAVKLAEGGEMLSEFSLYDIAIQPVLSPIDGVSINSLNVGDEIFIKVLDTDEVSRWFARGDGITSGRITLINRLDNDRSLVTVEIGPGFSGNFVVKNDVKLKVTKGKDIPKQKMVYSHTTAVQPKIESESYDSTFSSEERELGNKVSTEKVKGSSFIFWVVNLLILGVGVALVLIILLFL